MQPIKVGIIGLGRSGQLIHGNYLVDDPRYKIVAVSDLMPDRLASTAERYGAEGFSDYRQILARQDLDLVINATLSYNHAPVTIEAFKAGHNVLCEKPLATTVAEADAMIAAAEASGKMLAIFQQSRFAPYFKQVRRVIESGVLGRIVQISIAFNGHARRWDWQTLSEYSGGNLANTGPHPLDQALQLFGEGQPEVFCRMDKTDSSTGDAENHVKLILTGPNNPIIDLEISSCCAYPGFTYQVYGSHGGLTATQREAKWRYYDPASETELKLHREPLVTPEGAPSYCGEKLVWHEKTWPEEAVESTEKQTDYAPYNPESNMTEAFYDMLHETMVNGKPLEITPQQVRRQVAVIEECHRQNPQIYTKYR